jgi:hypothetical protein
VSGVKVVKIVSASVVGVLSLLAFVLAGAASLEFLLKVRSHWLPPYPPSDGKPRYHKLDHAYEPFGYLRLHPQYLFFFPLDPRERVAISNETCSIDADGFRFPGPAHAGGRRLAFLLGGSAAFSLYASSDATTITAYLNRLQDEYFFVSAGVPSWNSTQELFRTAFQLLDYRPALVITYDGFNDAGLLFQQNSHSSVHYPVGTPTDFDVLEALVDEHRSARGRVAAAALSEYLFPELTQRIEARLERLANAGGAAQVGPPTVPESVLQEGAARYLANLALIRDLATARGARFIAIFQPVAHLHRHLGRELPIPFPIDGFHRTVLTKHRHDFELHDLGDVFDRYYATIPVVNPDITDSTIFVDQVHLYDPGNEIVARELARLIR